MKQRHQQQAGFTAVELLITLFVAAAFLIAAYQLFNVVIKDGGQARAESRAGNVAYDYMRRYTSSAATSCTAFTPVSGAPITAEGLTNAAVTVAITCPAFATTSVSKIEVTITYNTPQQTVKYATYAVGSSPDLLTNLVGWWPLNGSANAAIGGANGVISGGVTLTTDSANRAASAYSFDGASAGAITMSSTLGMATTNSSISAWIYNPSSINKGAFVKVGAGPTGYGIGMGNGGMDVDGNTLIVLYENVRWIATTSVITIGWHHVVLTIDGSGVPAAYLDGALASASYSGAGAVTPVTQSFIGGYSGVRYFNGSIDDVRFYSRTLSAGDVSSLYLQGAK